MGNIVNNLTSCCVQQQDRENELNDGRVTHEPAFGKTDEEVWVKVDEVFYKYDINMDEMLDRDEIRPYLETLSGSSDDDQIEAIWKQIDTDGDGQISKNELFDYLKLNT